MQGFSGDRPWPQMLSIATDGESYGHHHRYGEMALSYALHLIEHEGWAKLTNYGEYLGHHTPTAEVQIWNNSSWSCVHGVERWRSDCGCNSGSRAGWHQRWRAPLREAFRYLAGKADEIFDLHGPRYFRDPEKALLDYVHVLLHNRTESTRAFLRQHALETDNTEAQVQALRLMEIMRNAQLIFTSCAWFFDEVSGLETVQNMKYAGRLVQLLHPYAPNVEAKFISLLERAPSNTPRLANAADAYRLYVKPHVIDLHRVIAHHAIANFDRADEGFQKLFCHELHERDCILSTLNGTHLKICRISVRSLIDGESIDSTAIVLHFGGHDFRCSITGPMLYTAFEQLKDDILTAYERRSLTELVRVVDEHFGRNYFSLEHVLSEGRRDLLQRITMEAFGRFDTSIRMIFEENRKLMDYLLDVGAPLPGGFVSAADFVLKTRFLTELQDFLKSGEATALTDVAREAVRYKVRMNDPMVVRRLEQAMEHIFHELALSPTPGICRVALALLDVLETLELKLDNWEAQNIVFALNHGRPLPAHLGRRVSRRAEFAPPPIPELAQLAEKLRVSLEPMVRTSSSLMQRTSNTAAPMSRGGSSERVEMIRP